MEAIREEVEEADNIDYDDYPYRRPSYWSCIIDGSLRSSPRYDKHGREILELGSFHNSELGSLISYTEEEDDIDARLAALDQKLMTNSFRNLTLESLEGEDEKMERYESKYLPQYICPSNKGKQNLREEGTHWESPAIVEATSELKNWAWQGAVHPMEDFVKKIKIVKPITPIKKIKTVKPVIPTKNIVSVPIESVFASITILVESVCDSIPIESVKNFFSL